MTGHIYVFNHDGLRGFAHGPIPPRLAQLRWYLTVADFYRDDQERAVSPEAQYGVWWQLGGSRGQWRISYVQRTGEVYAVNWDIGQESDGPLVILGTVPPDGGPETLHVYYHTLDAILAGYGEVCLGSASVEWVYDRLLSHGYAAASADGR